MSRESKIQEHNPREPRSVSLKVLRLSRPSLSQQYPLPRENNSRVSQQISLAYPPSNTNTRDFILADNLNLPPAFGSAYVGETFSCSLCVNNELPAGTTSHTLSAIRVAAEMQTPSQSIPLQLYSSDPEPESTKSAPGESLQKIIRFDLKEEGNHVLAVVVSYIETLQNDSHQPTSGTVKSFRKLYQFLTQPCLSVRTKATELTPFEIEDKSLGPKGRSSLLRYALEAQLENVSDGTIILETSKLQARPPFKATSLNWDVSSKGAAIENPQLNSRDVLQIAFLVEQQQGVSEGVEDLKTSLKREGRAVLGQLSLEWRSAMGERGQLSTGNLLTRRKIS
jgi:trafficking protein particle complex subunit 13